MSNSSHISDLLSQPGVSRNADGSISFSHKAFETWNKMHEQAAGKAIKGGSNE